MPSFLRAAVRCHTFGDIPQSKESRGFLWHSPDALTREIFGIYYMTKTRWIFISVIAAGVVTYSLYRAFLSASYGDAAAWVQVILAALGIPVLYFELTQIRRAIEQKPVINVGVANVNDLPLSKLRATKSLTTKTSVIHGHPHFWLAIRNQGLVAAKSVKIHMQYIPPKRASLLLPVIEVGDWLGDNRYSFKKVNNADFVFIGGLDWILHAKDTDMFDFDMTTAYVKQKEPTAIKERPELGDYEFLCTVWADGLDKPIVETLTVSIKESIGK